VHEETLIDIGLSPNEAKIYLSLLSIGISTVTSISDDSKLHRANVYDSLKKLIDKGLVSHIKRDNSTYYEATNPQSLLRLIKEKENKIIGILPQLLLSKKLATSKGEANVYEGISALMNMLYELLNYDEEILVYGIPRNAPELMNTKIPHFHVERLKRKISMKHIYNHDAGDRIKILNEMPLTFAKYLPEKFESQVSTNVCGEEVIIVLWSKPVISVRIKSKLIADSYKKYFSLLWKAAKQ